MKKTSLFSINLKITNEPLKKIILSLINSLLFILEEKNNIILFQYTMQCLLI